MHSVDTYVVDKILVWKVVSKQAKLVLTSTSAVDKNKSFLIMIRSPYRPQNITVKLLCSMVITVKNYSYHQL